MKYLTVALKDFCNNDSQYVCAKKAVKYAKDMHKLTLQLHEFNPEVHPEIEVVRDYMDMMRAEALLKQIEAELTLEFLKNNKV